MKLSSLLFYWLLLLIPTIALGVFGWHLLRQEESRLAEAAESARTERARIVAENLVLFLEEAQGGIVANLSEMPPNDPGNALESWTNTNPLVRQSFIWRPHAGVIPPINGPKETQSRFHRRYEQLLAPRTNWENTENSLFQTAPQRSLRKESPQKQESAAANLTPRQELKQLADNARVSNYAQQSAPQAAELRSANSAMAEASPRADSNSVSAFHEPAFPGAIETPRVVSFGWIPFLDGEPLSAIAWVELQPGGEIRGAEVDLDGVLTRMLEVLPNDSETTETYRLLDQAGHFFPVTTSQIHPPNSIRLDLGPLLPGWQLLVDSPESSAAGGRGFLLLSSLLLGVLLISILSGGSLLLLQAHRHQVDARQKSGFVSNVSHELKTPLTTIRMYAELIGENRVRDEARKRDFLRVIISESQRLTRLINNVLDFSRLEQESKTIDPQAISLIPRLNEILDAHEIRLTAAGIQLIREFPETELTASVDTDSLEQAVLNLIDNAIKYATDGGELRVTVDSESDSARIHFLDKGPGIEPDQERRLFEKFYRGDTSLTAKQPGCGLGLNIARRLLQRTGGNLVYRSRPGGGACFTISLPHKAQNQQPT